MEISASLDSRFCKPRKLFFVIGAQKAGTSWLDDYLRTRSEVCLPVHKELHYWSLALKKDAPTQRLERIRNHAARDKGIRGLARRMVGRAKPLQDRAWRLEERMFLDPRPDHSAYADVLFQNYDGQPVVGEMSPTYALLHRNHFSEMRLLNDSVGFIFIMRDPVERFFSGLRHDLRQRGQLDITRPEMEREVLVAIEQLHHPAILLSRYDFTLRELSAAVSPSDTLLLFYEDLFQAEQIRRIDSFLDIPPGTPDLKKRVHVGVGADIELSCELVMKVYDKLKPVYDHVERYAYGHLPLKWRRYSAGAE